MSSERDIDDILNSLNQLLREGESHNDDHTEAEDTGAVSAAEVPPEPKLSRPVEKRPEPAAKAKAESPAAVRDDAPEDVEQADEPRSSNDAPVSLHRVVLTEDMMINNPQGSLLSLAGRRDAAEDGEAADADADADADAEDSATQGEAKPAQDGRPHIDPERMALLINQISDDLIERMRRELPPLIADSLYRHLKELKRDE